MLTTLLQSQGTGATIVCNLIPSSAVFYPATIIQPGVDQTISCQLFTNTSVFYPCSVIKRTFVSYPGPVSTDPSFTTVRKRKRRSKRELEALMVKREKQRLEEEAFFIFLNEIL